MTTRSGENPQYLKSDIFIIISQVTARLLSEEGVGVEVADSRLLASHEGQERLVTLARLEGDTLRHYSQILRGDKR